MAITLTIKILRVPQAGQGFRFTLYQNGVAVAFALPAGGSALSVVRTFQVSAGFQSEITIGSNVNATAENVRANLNAYCHPIDTAITFDYSVSGNTVTLRIAGPGALVVDDVAGTPDFVAVYVLDDDSAGMAPVNVDLFSIEITDTYTNERTLIDEYSEADSLKLNWDSGDDIFSAFMASSLAFNMLVQGGADGHFLHLLTGDEKRYLVQLRNTDAEGLVTLLWQGFILPDLYNEPYTKGGLFVGFTASDMIASLKGKYFKSWVYYNTFNLPELLGMIFKETGLLQEMYVRVPFVNVSHGEAWQWRNTNLLLSCFAEGDDFKDLYVILETVLKAQALQLVSCRGKWLLTGLTRRGEASGLTEVYYPDGLYKETVDLPQEFIEPLFSTTPELTAETPWKKVNVNFETTTGTDLFPDDVVKRRFYSTRYRYDADVPDIVMGYINNLNNYWKKVAAPMCTWSGGQAPNFFYEWKFENYPSYYVTEAVAMANYFECVSKPYVRRGDRISLEIEAKITHTFTAVTLEEFIKDLGGNSGDYIKKIMLFQLMINGQEFLSNRPSHALQARLQFTKTFDSELPGYDSYHFYVASYKLSFEFVVPQDGEITLRLLPAFAATTAPGNLVWGYKIEPQVLQLHMVESVDKREGVVAVRPINYTREFDIDAGLIASPDTSIQNNLGYAARFGERVLTIPVADYDNPVNDTHYQTIEAESNNNYIPTPAAGTYQAAAVLHLQRYIIDQFYQDLIFRTSTGTKLVFLERPGEVIPYPALYTRTVSVTRYLAAYNGYTPDGFGQPYLPDGYKELPVITESDRLKIMVSLFYAEDRGKRALWKIYGFDDATAATYLQTLAYATHCVRPDTAFSFEGQGLKLLFPAQLPQFNYLGTARTFVPTRLELNLFKGKTNINMKEWKLEPLNDVSYE